VKVFSRLTGFLRNTFQDRFKRYLIVSLVILGIVFAVVDQQAPEPIPDDGFVVHFFWLEGCSACAKQKPFMDELKERYPEVHFIDHDYSREMELLREMLIERGEERAPFVPTTIFGNQVFMDWESEETTGREIETALQQCLAGECPEYPTTGREPDKGIDLPWFGRIVFAEHSLAALAVILGLVDGFNPCALWVLIYLISLVATLRDKKKIWLIVGSFVLASGVIYFLLMTAWLNLFLFIGFVRPVTVIIGLVALGGGILQTRDFIKSKGEVVCEVTSEESRAKTMGKMERIVSSPITIATILGIIALAFAVNSIEFVCSAAIPMVFTQVLALADLSTVQYYGYILLYVFFFILDNLIIFGSAAIAMTSSLGVKYAKYARPVGATILIVLGLLLLFAPDLLS
jgi:thiol-disulfide isomerase/thioredoxin